MRRVHEHLDGFHEHNFFLDLVLGLASGARRVERLIEAAAPRGGAAPPPVDAEDHPFDHFLLGVVSFARSVGRHLASAETARGGATEDPPRGREVRDLLL